MKYFPYNKYCKGYEISDIQYNFVKKYNNVKIFLLIVAYFIYTLLLYNDLYSFKFNVLGKIMIAWLVFVFVSDSFFYRKFKKIIYDFGQDFKNHRKYLVYTYIILVTIIYSSSILLYDMYRKGILLEDIITLSGNFVILYYTNQAKNILKYNS